MVRLSPTRFLEHSLPYKNQQTISNNKASREGRMQQSSLLLIVILLVSLSTKLEGIEASSYTVGGNSGWSYNIQSWTDGKKFKPGDTLIFKYDSSLHDVVAVGMSEYKGCSVVANSNSRRYSSGNDTVKLKKGQNYFICSIPGHCDAGLKLSIRAF